MNLKSLLPFTAPTPAPAPSPGAAPTPLPAASFALPAPNLSTRAALPAGPAGRAEWPLASPLAGPNGSAPLPLNLSPAGNANVLVAQLGLQTLKNFDGTVRYNEPLVQSLLNCGESALPSLSSLFMATNNANALLEGLYAATRMAEAGVKGMEQLYPALARWNSNPDWSIQMHLARFYRKINEPRTFGPMLSTAVYYAVNQYPMISMRGYNVSEEVGETLLSQIARRTAQETVRQLLPFLPNNPASQLTPRQPLPV